MHGYTAKSIENDPKIDHKTSKSCTMSSEFEALCFCYQRPGNYIEMHKGFGKKGNKSNTIINIRCRLMRTLIT